MTHEKGRQDKRGVEFFEYTHFYLEEEGVVVECTVYPVQDIRRVQKSSITGWPMDRPDAKRLRKIIGDMESFE